MRKWIIVLTLISILMLLLIAGCESYAEKKKDAQLRWEQAASRARVPAAEDAFNAGRVVEAHNTIKECIASDPKNPRAQLLMGKIRFVQGKIELARESLISALEIDKSIHQAWFLLAEIARNNCDDAEAVSCYKKAIDYDPLNTDYIVSLADAYAAMNQYEKSLALLETKLKAAPSSTNIKMATADLYLRCGRTKDAIKLYKNAQLFNPESRAVSEALGYGYIIEHQWSRAATIFQELANNATVPEKYEYLKLLAVCSMNAGDYGRAVASYDKLSVDQRDNEKLWLEMGQAALGAGAPNRGYACATRALELRPAWSEALVLKGCCQYLTSDYYKAASSFSQATSTDPENGFAWFMTGRCYDRMGNYKKAQDAYETAAGLNPESQYIEMISMNTK